MNRRNESIKREIEQGLREPGGAFVGGLVVLDFNQGWHDFQKRAAFPDNPSPSYELGRHRASLEAEEKADILDGINSRYEKIMADIGKLKKFD